MAASTTSSTKQKLLSLIEDVEIVSRELFEIMSTPKSQQRQGAPEPSELIQLLVDKDKEIKDSIKTAGKQGEVQKTIDELKHEVDKRDLDIKILQKNLKEAENVLSTAIFQAKQKLDSISQANEKRISSEELIKFAHRISASNAVEAPPTWQPGDPRRPYPTDYEMRSGWLAKMSDIPASTPALQAQGSYGEPMASNRNQLPGDMAVPAPPQQQTVTWQTPSDMTSSISSHPHTGLVDFKGHNKENEEVELMSSDSSSSSSSDE
ncbi:mediator of RNA polymerase II transcription subunit 4-like [Mercenaria mercenaria]|uniref:mediator of RNA polymerase II transcription subunit 4-like n=1 Tax=Mercenaria mercenaria TaxID=6596 RepID=UPI001E1D74FE|nr:mediator of RNA polymerase II transcription subunit 4-like [Mercenaria mercenaria]